MSSSAVHAPSSLFPPFLPIIHVGLRLCRHFLCTHPPIPSFSGRHWHHPPPSHFTGPSVPVSRTTPPSILLLSTLHLTILPLSPVPSDPFSPSLCRDPTPFSQTPNDHRCYTGTRSTRTGDEAFIAGCFTSSSRPTTTATTRISCKAGCQRSLCFLIGYRRCFCPLLLPVTFAASSTFGSYYFLSLLPHFTFYFSAIVSFLLLFLATSPPLRLSDSSATFRRRLYLFSPPSFYPLPFVSRLV